MVPFLPVLTSPLREKIAFSLVIVLVLSQVKLFCHVKRFRDLPGWEETALLSHHIVNVLQHQSDFFSLFLYLVGHKRWVYVCVCVSFLELLINHFYCDIFFHHSV